MWNLGGKETNPNQTYGKRHQLLLPEVGVGSGELDKGDQKVHTSRCKINKYLGCNVQHDIYSYCWQMVYLKIANRVNAISFSLYTMYVSLRDARCGSKFISENKAV